jgi:hypothetical protein
MPVDRKYLDETAHLQLIIEEATEGFLCQMNNDSEWRRYDYEKDGTQKVVTYEVTDETPPDRSVIIKNYDTGDEFVITWNVTVTKR